MLHSDVLFYIRRVIERKQTLILFKSAFTPKSHQVLPSPHILYYGIVVKNKAPYGVNLPYVKGQPFLNRTCKCRSQKFVVFYCFQSVMTRIGAF